MKNPPPLCIINIYKELKICVKVYDIDTSFKTLHGCLEVGFQTYRIPLVYVKLGCITAFDGKLYVILTLTDNRKYIVSTVL